MLKQGKTQHCWYVAGFGRAIALPSEDIARLDQTPS
jgi:hypothetical protein